MSNQIRILPGRGPEEWFPHLKTLPGRPASSFPMRRFRDGVIHAALQHPLSCKTTALTVEGLWALWAGEPREAVHKSTGLGAAAVLALLGFVP